MANASGSGPLARTVVRIWRHPANARRRARRLGLWLAWQVWERAVRRPWTLTFVPGLTVELAPHDPVTSGVLYCGMPDWPEMPFVLDYLRPGDVMVDVGANVGLYSLLAASVEGVRAVAFEPDDGAREQAAANVARNGLSARVDIRPQAVASAPGEGALTAGLGPMNHLVVGTDTLPRAMRRVGVVALDGAVDGPVALVKVDVEGAEAAVLDGAERLLGAYRPALILEANDPAALTARLEPLGYQWVRYDPSQRVVVPAPAPSPGQNGIAVADLVSAGHRLARRPPL